MKLLLLPPLGRKMWLVDWHGILPFWQRSWQYAAVKEERLIDAYSTHWFEEKSGKRRLVLGDIYLFPKEQTAFFSNGSHRTRVLASHLRYLPLCARAACYQDKLLAPYFLRRIEKDEEFEMPDLPILTLDKRSARPIAQ